MGILDQWQDRWDFSVYNNEQRFQTKLVTKRQFFTNVVNLPLARIQNRMLRKDVEAKGFDAAAFRFIDDVLIGAGGGQLVRSFALAYKSNKSFRDVQNASRALEGFGMTAETYDQSPTQLSKEIIAGRNESLYNLVNNSSKAADLLDKFVHGALEITPFNIAQLQGHLEAMAKVCEEKAVLKEAYNALREPGEKEPDDQNKAAGYVRDVMRLDAINTPRQAQILAGFVSAVMVDSATPLGTEMFIPTDDIFLPPEEAIKLSSFVAQQMEHRGLVPNVSLTGAHDRPFADLPEGAMVKAVRDDKGDVVEYQKVSEEETMAFANALHGYIKHNLGNKVENMLRFVDRHFDDIENAVARSQEDPIPEPIPVWPQHGAAQKAEAQSVGAKVKEVWASRSKLTPHGLLEQTSRVVTTAFKHITRPEARHENNKLFMRSLAGQIISFPVKMLDETLKSMLEKDAGFDIAFERMKTGDKQGKFFGPSKMVDAAGNTTELFPIIDQQRFKGIVDSKTFALFTSPLVASVGTVASQELFHLPKGLAIEAAGRADSVLKGAIRGGHRHAPQVAGRLSAMQDGMHPSLKALLHNPLYKDAIPQISAKNPEERTEADYSTLASYYHELSHICVSVAEEALSPYGVQVSPDKIETMDEVVTRVLRKPVENVPDAMIALAYVESFVSKNAEKTGSMDYVDPTQLLIQHGDLLKLGNFIDEQAKSAGLVMAKGDEGKGIRKGELLEKGEDGQLQPISEQTLVRFANVVTEELKQHVNIDNLLYAIKGKNRKQYLGRIEDSLFNSTYFETGVKPEDEKPRLSAVNTPDERLTTPWQEKVKRQTGGLRANIKQTLEQSEVQHEVRKLYGRAKGTSISSIFPSLIYNSLQHNENIFTRAGIFSTTFKTIVYPILYSKGVVSAKETLNEVFLKRRHIVNESDVTRGLIEGALATAGELQPDLKDQLIESNQVNADMIAIEKKDQYKDIPRIAAKPRHLRDERDNKLMQRFCDEVGEKLVDNSARIFAALGRGEVGESVSQVMERVLEAPVDNVKDAVIALGLMHSILQSNTHYLDVLTFVKPEDKVLSRSQIKTLTEFANSQAANAGFALHGVPIKGKNGNEFTLMGQGEGLKDGELLKWNDKNERFERADAESIVRYANVMTAKFREVAKDRLKDDDQVASLAQRYQRETKGQIFQHI